MENAQEGAKSDPKSAKARIRKLVWILLTILLTLAVYKNIYRSDFFLDDYLHLHLVKQIANPLVPYTSNLFMGAFFRPGVFIFWKLNHVLFGLNAAGYYATNILFLIALVAIFFFTVHHMIGSRAYAGFATALFAVSPVTGVGVLWLSNRFDLIGTVFYLLSLLLFLRYVRFQKRWDYIGAILSGVFSYFCKEMMVTLPVVMVISASFMFGYRATLNWQRFKRIVVLSTPFFTLGVLFILWRYGVIHSLGGYSGEIKVKLTSDYMKLLYAGFADYFWLMKSKLVFFIYIFLFILLLAKSDFLQNNPLTVLGLGLVVVTCLPLVMILRMQAVMTYMTPRFFFLPSIGMTLLLASVYDPKSGRLRKFLASAFIAVTVFAFMVNSFLLTYKWVEDRNESVKSMERVAEFISTRGEKIEQGQLFYVGLYGNDVAIDAGIKIRHPEFTDTCYFLNPLGPTQVVGTEALHESKGNRLTWPNTFDKNPCDFENLRYGIIETSPRDIVDQLEQDEQMLLIIKDEMGKLTIADREMVRNRLATLGVLQ